MAGFGIPYAMWELDEHNRPAVTCRFCGDVIILRTRKDFESFSMIEWAEHVEIKHPERMP